MSTTAGVFSETTLQSVRLMVDEAMLDVNLKRDYEPKWETLKAITENQTAKVKALENKDKDYTVEVEFPHACSLEVADNVACETGGVDVSTNVKSYTLSKSKMVKFDIDEIDYRSNDFEAAQLMAKAFLAADKALVEQINKTAIASLFANKGTNSYAGSIGTISGTDTNIAPANWTAATIPYFQHVAVHNEIKNPFIINGDNLFEAYAKAAFDSGNADGKGDVAAYNYMKMYWDIPTMDTESSAVVSYMVDKGAMFFASRSKYPEQMQTLTWGKRWTMPSQFVPGLIYDVLLEEACSSDFNKTSFKVVANYDVLAAPTGCTSTKTGVFRFVNT